VEDLLKALTKMMALISDYDRVVSETAGMEFLITKHNKLGETDNVNVLLDELDNLKIQLKVINDLSKELFGVTVPDLRFIAVSVRAGVEHHEEILNDVARVRRTVEILEAAQAFDDDDGKQRDELFQNLTILERQVRASIDSLQGLIPSGSGEEEDD
jgi:hypothetical protein